MEVAVSLGLFLVMAQTAAIFSRLVIPWGDPLERILRFFRFLALDLGILQLDCTVGMGFVSRFIAGSVLPIAVIVIYMVATAVLLKLQMHDSLLRCVNSIGLITQTLYVGFLLHGVGPHIMYQHPNGMQSMS